MDGDEVARRGCEARIGGRFHAMLAVAMKDAEPRVQQVAIGPDLGFHEMGRSAVVDDLEKQVR